VIAVLLALALGELQLERFSGRLLLSREISIVGRGEYLAATQSTVYHWDSSGRLILEIPAPDQSIFLSAWFNGRYYWVCTSRPYQSLFYDTDGNLRHTLTGSDNTYEFFEYVDNQLFGVVSWSMDLIYEQPYMYQLQKIDLGLEGDKPVIRAYGDFAKIRRRQREMLFNFRNLFLVRRGDTYLLMNEVEDRILLFDKENLAREHRDGTRIPTEVDSVRVPLEGYVPPPRELFRVGKPMPTDQALQRRLDWLRSFSKIALLAAYDEGFVVSYTIPVCEGGNCKVETGVQRLDHELRPVGSYIHLKGRTVGVHGNKFYSMINPDDLNSGELVRINITDL